MDNYKTFCTHIQLDTFKSHELKIALTHFSFNENGKNGSRYVFLGQTEFKGKVARILFEFVEGKGTQLQHYLGNLFKTKHLKLIFYKYNLEKLIRYGGNFDWENHKHIFTYALLGFLSDNMNEKQLNAFIYQNFIQYTSHLLPDALPNKKDYKSQVFFLCKLYYNSKPKLKIIENEGIYTFQLDINSNVLFETQSKSYKYGQRKIWKNTLKFIVEKEEEKLLSDPEFIAKEKRLELAKEERITKEKEKKLAAYFEKRQKRSAEIKEKKESIKKISRERDMKRRASKQRANERKEQLEKQKKLKEMQMKNISSAKRRILEDRGILPKKK